MDSVSVMSAISKPRTLLHAPSQLGVDATFRTTILGYNFSQPFFIAPAADAGHANKSAEASLASAAGKAGILYAVCFSPLNSTTRF
jgi:isopentenyl diphosphate isomerase/L-lactate dehydrogenase-like FMN-dependent dehydrogenase